MKKRKLIESATAILLGASMTLSLAACADKSIEESKVADSEKIAETEKTDETEEPVESIKTQETKKPSSSSSSDRRDGFVSPTAPDSYEALTEQNLYDTWVDENGVYMHFAPDGILTDYLGNQYQTEIIGDCMVRLSVMPKYMKLLGSIMIDDNVFEFSPVPTVFNFPMYLDGDELTIGENHLYRATGATGSEYVQDLYDRIVDTDFAIQEFYSPYAAAVTKAAHFGSDMNCSLTKADPLDGKWSYDDGLIRISESILDEKYVSFYRIDDEIFLMTSDRGDMVCFTADTSDEDEDYDMNLECILCKESFDGDFVYEVNITDSVGEMYDIRSYEEITDLTYIFDLSSFNPSISIDGAEMELKCSSAGIFLNAPNWENGFMFPRNSIFGQLMLYREDVLKSKLENIFIPDTYTVTSDDITLEVTPHIYTNLAEYWPFRIGSPEIVAKYEPNAYPDAPSKFNVVYGPVASTSQCVDGTQFKWTIPKTKFASADLFTVTFSGSYDVYDALGRNEWTDYELTETSDEFIITLQCDYWENWFGICSPDNLTDPFHRLTWDEVLASDPKNCKWGRNFDTGDILDLVDVDYIADSIIDDLGSANFWVSTPEQLASATYYINTLEERPSNSERVPVYYIHLMNDIDLAGYEWAPIGQENSMNGIIFGNGYAIKNMNMGSKDALILACSSSTFIGLTIENPIYSIKTTVFGDIITYDVLFSDEYNCFNEAIDCKIIIDSQYLDILRFGSDGNFYTDCSFYDFDADSGLMEEIPLDGITNPAYNMDEFYDNWVSRYYRNEDGTYSYDAAGEYSAYCSNPAPFNDGSYYFDDGSDTPVFQTFNDWPKIGYLYNGEFMVPTGFVAYVPEY